MWSFACAKPQEPRERQSVAHLILDLFVGQIVKRLQHQHPKHHHDVDRLAASAALLLAHRRQHRRLDLRALSNGTTRAIISSGSPFAEIAASRLSASKNPNCPIVPTLANLVVTSQTRTNSRRSLFFEVPVSDFGIGRMMNRN
jgi:hypothetical protein